MQQQNRPLLLAGRLYGLMLRAYPAAFQREYGYHMAQLFRDEMRATIHERGPAGLPGLWFNTFLDLVKTAAAEHISVLLRVPTMRFFRWSGLAAMLGGAMFYSGVALAAFAYERAFGLSPVVYVAILGAVLLSLPLLALALFGLYRRLPRGMAAGLVLIVAEVGVFLYIIGVLTLFTTDFVDEAMTLIMAGAVLLGFGLLGLGLVGLVGRTLGRWSIGPLMLGAGHIAFTLGTGGSAGQVVLFLSMVALLIGWFLVGAALWTGRAEDPHLGLPA